MGKEIPNTKQAVLVCPNCGAPIRGDKCEYCGTRFYDFATIDLNEPCLVRIRVNNHIIQGKMYVSDMSLTQYASRESARDMAGRLYSFAVTNEANIHIDLSTLGGFVIEQINSDI